MFKLNSPKNTRYNQILLAVAILFPVLVLLLWQFASTHGLVKASLVPPPLTIGGRLFDGIV